MTTIANILKAAAIGLPLMAATPAEASISAPSAPSVNPSEETFMIPPQQEQQLADSCKMRIISYFSDENLRDIDSALHGINAWFTERNMPAPRFEAYEQGGVNYLARDPGNVIAAVEIYRNHVDVQRLHNPAAIATFDKEEGKALNWLERVSIDTMIGIAQQVDTGCRAPAPEIAPIPVL